MLFITMIACLLLFGLPLYGLRGGAGMLLFAAIVSLLSALLIAVLSPLLAMLAHQQPHTLGLLQFTLYAALCLVALPVGSYINRFVQFSVDPFDWMLGFLFGAITGIIMTHYLLSYLLVASIGTPTHHLLAQSTLVHQVINFEWWHNLTNYMSNLGSTRSSLSMPE